MRLPVSDQGRFKLSYQHQQICQTVTAYCSTDKGRGCDRGLVSSSSAEKICLFSKAPLATSKSSTTAPRPHCLLDQIPKYTKINSTAFLYVPDYGITYSRSKNLCRYDSNFITCVSACNCGIQFIQVVQRQM